MSKTSTIGQPLEHGKATQSPFPTPEKPLIYLLQDCPDLQCILLIFKEHFCFLKSKVSPGLGCHCECLNFPSAKEIAHDSHMVHH